MFFKPHILQMARQQHRLPQCGRCGLFKNGCQSPKMPPTGKGKRSILIVAEAPGQKEDEENTHLVGPAGQKVREVLKELKVSLDDCTNTTAIICAPGKHKPSQMQIESCRPTLLNTIRSTKPNVIILMGGYPVRSLIPTEREGAPGAIGKWVGWTIPSAEYNAWICPTYHPSYLLREKNPVLDRLWKRHLKRAIALEHTPPNGLKLDDLKKRVEVILNPRAARLRLKKLAKQKGRVAFDYETTGIKPESSGDRKHRIVACSFCLNGEDTFSFLVDESHHGLMRQILRSPDLLKDGHNIKMEERWSKKILGIKVRPWRWDSMIGSHVLDNRGGISSLKFQMFVWTGIADYNSTVSHYLEDTDAEGFNKIDDCPKEDLCTYNGIDALGTDIIGERQRKVFERAARDD